MTSQRTVTTPSRRCHVAEAIALELGDVLFYVTAIAADIGFDLMKSPR